MLPLQTTANGDRPHFGVPFSVTYNISLLQAEAEKLSGFTPIISRPRLVIYLNFFDYSLPSLMPSQSLSFEEEKAVESKSRSLALMLQLGRRL